MSGRRPKLPDAFEAEHAAFTSLMQSAWATNPAERPTFSTIVFSLKLIAPGVIVPGVTTVLCAPLALATTRATKANGSRMDELAEPLLPPE